MQDVIFLSKSILEIFLEGFGSILETLETNVSDLLPSAISNIIQGIALLLPGKFGEDVEAYVKLVLDNSLLNFMFGSGLSIFVILVIYSFFKRTVLNK